MDGLNTVSSKMLCIASAVDISLSMYQYNQVVAIQTGSILVKVLRYTTKLNIIEQQIPALANTSHQSFMLTKGPEELHQFLQALLL